MSYSSKLKKIIELFFLNFNRFDSFYLHSVSLPKNSTLIHYNFRVLSWRYHIHFKCRCFPCFTSLHAGIRGLVVYKKGKEKRIKNEIKVFRNGKWSVHRNFFLCFHGSNNQKKSRKKLPSMRFRIFKSTYCELRGNRIHQFDFRTVPQNATAWSRETTHIQSSSFFLD